MIGMPEILMIGALIIILFGAKKLPQLGEGLGKGIRNFKNSVTGADEKKVDDTSSAAEKNT